MTGAFRTVQKFLRSSQRSRQISLSSFILCHVAKQIAECLEENVNETLPLLEDVESPLQRHDPNHPDPRSCPYNTDIICDPHDPFRTFDGSCNNLRFPNYGQAYTPFIRFIDPDYGDGLETLRQSTFGGPLPSARLVSRSITGTDSKPNPAISLMLMQWGQFLDHDLTLTAISGLAWDQQGTAADVPCGRDGCDGTAHPACAPIAVPQPDPYFTNHTCLPFVRSQNVPEINCRFGPVQQINQLTSWIDASNVYGSSDEEAVMLRDDSSDRGFLRVTPHPSDRNRKPLLPQGYDPACAATNQSQHSCFIAGDVRANEQSTLTVMHTMWVREHNRIANHLHQYNPHWSGSRIFNETRKLIGAMMQHITYNEFLPVVLGRKQMLAHGLHEYDRGGYDGYNYRVDGGIANVFATAAFRFGHSLIPGQFKRASQTYNTSSIPEIPISTTFFRPETIYNTHHGGLDGFVRGLASQSSEEVDNIFSHQITVHLFTNAPSTGLGTDLVALNIQRGRDHGLPGYNAWREWCGLSRAEDFSLMLSIPARLRHLFRRVYNSVDDVDLFIAALSEEPVEAGLVGPTLACILGRQFLRVRSADRFWYENSGPQGFTRDQIAEVRKVTLARVLCSNGDDIDMIQSRAMEQPFRLAFPLNNYTLYKDYSSLTGSAFNRLWQADYNHRRSCDLIPDLDLSKWQETL